MTTLVDTRTVAEPDRADYWSTGITEHFFPVGVQWIGSQPFTARLSGVRLGAIAACSIVAAPHGVTRTARMVSEADPDCILLYLLRRGSCTIEQDGRSYTLSPGDLALHNTSRPSSFSSPVGLDVAVFSFPKWLLDAKLNGFAGLTATKIADCKEPMVDLARPFLTGLARTVESSSVTDQEAEGLSDMLIALLTTLHSGGSAPAARLDTLLAQMRHYATEHLSDPELGPEQIARAHFVSTRYVHKLFAASGYGVCAWIREQRLERALAELRLSGDTSIANTASRWGYRDAASFSRAFRRAYGRSPSDARRSN